MSKKIILAIVAVAAIIIGITLYWQFKGDSSLSNQSASVLNSQQNQQDIRIITALHQFRNGGHIVAGEIDLPTPCHTLNHEVTVAESSPEQVTINFTTLSNDDDVCAQVITPARYKINFQASENAVIKATWNGAPAQLNLVPVPAGDNLDDFEVFIKG